MDVVKKRKSRRVRGAELVVTGGITMFLSSIMAWFAPAAICVYGLYRWFFRKSYKDGITIMAVGIILILLLKGPLSFLLWLSTVAGGTLVGFGAVLMIWPTRKKKGEIIIEYEEEN